MATLSLVSGRNVDPTRPEDSIMMPYVALEDVTQGLGAIVADGGVSIADAGTEVTCDGIFLQTKYSGQPVDIMIFGPVAGFDLSSQSIGDLIYMDPDNGTLVDTQAAKDILIGKVVPSQVEASGKVLWINALAAMLGVFAIT